MFLDLITVRFLLGYSTRPLHVLGGIGLLMAGLGLLSRYAFDFRLTGVGRKHRQPAPLVLAVLLVILGVQMISMGLLAEMITRTYYEAQNKPIYVIREQLGD